MTILCTPVPERRREWIDETQQWPLPARLRNRLYRSFGRVSVRGFAVGIADGFSSRGIRAVACALCSMPTWFSAAVFRRMHSEGLVPVCDECYAKNRPCFETERSL
jgi:hypothetical protein